MRIGTNSRYCFACGGADYIQMNFPIYLPPRNAQTVGSIQAGRPPPPRLLPQQMPLGALAPSCGT